MLQLSDDLFFNPLPMKGFKIRFCKANTYHDFNIEEYIVGIELAPGHPHCI